MAVVNLIRHGQTAGNAKKRYIGVTDEHLSARGAAQLSEKAYPPAEAWFLSPMRRCLETAAVAEEKASSGEAGQEWENEIWKKRVSGFLGEGKKIIVPDFRECDFGLFENKNYMELADCPEYQAWINSGGRLPFPGGEAVEEFKSRCCLAFEKMVERICQEGWTAVNAVVHGGTIMSIMERYARPQRDYYEWHVDNGGGYTLVIDPESWRRKKILDQYRKL